MSVNQKSFSLPTFADQSDPARKKPTPWAPLLVPREAIEMEIERLMAIPQSASGRRSATIVHPQAGDTLSLTPATDVTINVLLPGERSLPVRRNANQLEICIRGKGQVHTDSIIHTQQFDVWNIPSMRTYSHQNDGSDVWVRLTYSNAPLLEKLGTLFSEEGPSIKEEETAVSELTVSQKASYVRQNAPDLRIDDSGASLRGYEFLTDIQVVPDKTLHWRWVTVKSNLSQDPTDGKRRILLLYNPATERRNGTSNSFFATYGGCPPGSAPFTGTRGHRHTSASINYHTRGYGKSIVNGVTLEWKAGDLLFSAPSWSEHAHYHGPDGWTVLTVQDHPMHIAMGSLLWQEQMLGPIFTLGLEAGQTGYTSPRMTGL